MASARRAGVEHRQAEDAVARGAAIAKVGIVGATPTPTPSADTHATTRPRGFFAAVQEAQAALERKIPTHAHYGTPSRGGE